MTLQKPSPPLHSEGIALTPLERRHLDPMEALGYDDDVAAYTFVPVPFDADRAVTWLGRYIQGWRDGSRAGFAIEDEETGEFLGFCALVTLDLEGAETEIGYITAPHARGRGVAVAALKLITAWAKDELGMKRIELHINPDNEASMKVAERAGFEREGLLRSVHLKQGIRTDLVVLSIVTR